MSRLVGLYPRAWRARYGEELEDLAAARPLGLGSSIDLIRGAVDAHRHPELVDSTASPAAGREPTSRQRYEDLKAARRLGQGAIAGAVALVVAVIVAINGRIVVDDGGSYRDGMAAVPFLLLAMVLMSGGLTGHVIRMGPGHPVAKAGASVAIFSGPLWSLGPWLFPLGLLWLAGLLTFAAATWWRGMLSGPGALAVTLPAAISVAVVVAGVLAQVDRLTGYLIFTTAITVLAPIWLAVGGALQGLPDMGDIEDPPLDPSPEATTA